MLFCRIFLAHVLSDFVFQSDSLVKNKKKFGFLFIHCLIFLILSLLILLPSFSWKIFFILGALSLSHGVIDFLKLVTERWFRQFLWASFLVDQGLHILAIGAAIFLLDTTYFLRIFEKIIVYLSSPYTILVASFFVLIVFGGSFFVGLICANFIQSMEAANKPGVAKAGRYIGMLERSLILTVVLLNKIELIGFIFAAKSIVRYPEITRETNFAEYYLIGTFTSISIAFFGGLLFKYLLGFY